jgi:hypothetical protein
MEETREEVLMAEETVEEPATKKPNFEIPTEFKKIIIDMTKDILVSFPEQEVNLHKELKNLVFGLVPEGLEQSLKYVFVYCKTFYPVRFFDILYQNQTIFDKDNDANVYFLPGINFKTLWNENISDKTRETIWKYLQLVLFTVVSGVTDERSFGDTAKLFEAVNEDEFKAKLEETISQMHSLFENKNGSDDNADGENVDGENADDNENANNADSEKNSGINLDDLPNPSDIHDHVTGMMNGKLGKLAKEIAEETAAELNIDMENASSISDVFKNLIKNPTKLLSLVKNVGSKLDEKLKSGDMKESELLEEASELMKKMKNMPGMGDLQSMFSKMGMNPGKGSGKVNVNAMQSNLDQKLKGAKNRERILKNLLERQTAAAERKEAEQEASKRRAQAQAQASVVENLVFTTGESAVRSTPSDNMQGDKKKKKKNKK